MCAMRASISLGVTMSPAWDGSPRSVPAEMTVGTPTAMTGTPMVRRSKAVRVLPMPLPGTIPVSASCTVQQRRFSSQAARASTAIKVPAPLAWAIPRTISALSSPVEARTPGAKAQQSAKGPNRSGRRRRR